MNAPDHCWRPVPGYEGWYEAHPTGAIRSVDRVIPVTSNRTKPYSIQCRGKVLRPTVSKGYPMVTLWRRHVGQPTKVATYIALTFHGPRPPGLYVCHRDGNRSNSSSDNLYYGTPTENVEDMRRHGTMRRGEGTSWAKLTEEQVRLIRENPDHLLQRELGARFGIKQSRVSKIQRGQQWAHVV